MKTTTQIAAASFLLAIAGQVQAQTIVEDMDVSGDYSLEELQAAYADLTEEQFTAMDSDEDGAVSFEELAAAREAGLIAE